MTVRAAEKYKVTFNSNGGTAVKTVTAYENTTIDAPYPTRKKYRFYGWYKDSECRQEWDFDTDKIKEDTTLYARWFPVDPYYVSYIVVHPTGYTLSYDESFYNDFEYNYIGDDDKYSTFYGYIQTEMERNSAVVPGELLKQPIDPVLKGYTFIGWYNEETGKKWNFATDKFTKKDAGLTLKPRWKKASKSYKVTFNTNKGTSLKPLTIANDSRIARPKDPIRSGYKFTGWYKDAKCTTLWNFDSDRITSKTTLYAGWKKVKEEVF